MYWDDEYAMQQYIEPSWDVWSELDDTVGLWYGTYREHWGVDGYGKPHYLPDDEWKAAQQEHDLASKLLRVAMALNLFAIATEKPEDDVAESDLKSIRNMLRSLAKSTQVRDRIGLDLASQAISQLSESTTRCMRLLGILRAQNMSPRASLFIGRATRLYVWGFDPEAAIMCRAALETALAERLSEHFNQDGQTPSLDGLLRLAGETGVLEGYQQIDAIHWRARTKSPLWRAQRLKWTGNYVVHDEPTLGREESHIADGFNAIREFSAVLGYLFPGSVGPPSSESPP